ncbi:hypothetical protein A8D95_11070 [Burkholderia cenocepacia]|uniref:Uncharacterized protein n=1 Tax=Burkholderia cenocepacia TaxID=95486 RepID=A0A1V2WAB3_9BURK|nr:hypothetical protein A8D83_01525 [Burkholderia cenocepacia]ONJ28132.1 hypothetical protein A8D90_16710 [Burkholderia cenocepacia]ONP24330.1 hypothetical protein A8D84_24510 [Burkholderia cenocepacia]ONP29791.1 hypothetical protein A8D85_33040 [Burkholderia cenocepacia]ONP38367.1 hypothetical protein A8D86_21975 [Burkholderia cenocepacia]
MKHEANDGRLHHISDIAVLQRCRHEYFEHASNIPRIAIARRKPEPLHRFDLSRFVTGTHGIEQQLIDSLINKGDVIE